MSKKTRQKIEAVVDALDDAPIDDATARETVAKLGIDIRSLASKLRTQIAKADATDRKERFADARAAYADELERLEQRKIDRKPTREEQLVVFRGLIAKAPDGSVAAHFHKYEAATDDELAELIRGLRHLLGEDES